MLGRGFSQEHVAFVNNTEGATHTLLVNMATRATAKMCKPWLVMCGHHLWSIVYTVLRADPPFESKGSEAKAIL